jgi:hypothetical protein
MLQSFDRRSEREKVDEPQAQVGKLDSNNNAGWFFRGKKNPDNAA